jgi:hypothetical protein
MLKKEVIIPLFISIIFTWYLYTLQTNSGEIKFAINTINQIVGPNESDNNLEIYYKKSKVT